MPRHSVSPAASRTIRGTAVGFAIRAERRCGSRRTGGGDAVTNARSDPGDGLLGHASLTGAQQPNATGAGARNRRRPRWGEAATILVMVALTGLTATMFALPEVTGHIVAPGLDLVLDTVATLVTLTVAFLCWGRWIEFRDPVDHTVATAFLALGVANIVAVLIGLNGVPASTSRLIAVAQGQAYVFAVGRALAAVVLVVGGMAAVRGQRFVGRGRLLLAPAAVTAATVVVVAAAGEWLPPLVDLPGGVGYPAADVTTTPLGMVIELAGATLSMLAAAVWYRLWRQTGSRSQGYLALGLVFASFAQVHTVSHPSIHPLQVSSGDLLWLAFAAMLVLAIEAETGATLAALRRANRSLEEMRLVDVERAALEERSRVSRELHDGLAQHLWRAKLKAGRLAANRSLDAEAATLSGELSGIIDTSLAEARYEVMALRRPTDDTHSEPCAMLHRVVDDFADRAGLRAEFDCDHSRPRLEHRVEAELVRIVQEALTNVQRHADATLVRVRFESRDDAVAVSVADNGRGFDPGDIPAGGYGLVGMRERASLISGQLHVDSRRSDGTRITVLVPATHETMPARQAHR